MTDKNTLNLAHEWAEWVKDTPVSDRARAAADLISSLPDEWVDASELRYAISAWEFSNIPAAQFVDMVRDTLPTPPAPESASPRPEDVPVGEPWQVEVGGRAAIGYRNDPESRLCWAFVSRDDATGRHWVHDSDVTLIARLVPETTEQDDEPDFDPAYTYRDRDGDKWLYVEGAWRWVNASCGSINGDYRTPPIESAPYARIEDAK